MPVRVKMIPYINSHKEFKFELGVKWEFNVFGCRCRVLSISMVSTKHLSSFLYLPVYFLLINQLATYKLQSTVYITRVYSETIYCRGNCFIDQFGTTNFSLFTINLLFTKATVHLHHCITLHHYHNTYYMK